MFFKLCKLTIYKSHFFPRYKFHANYIIFRNVEIFNKKKILKETKKFHGIFGHISFVEIESSKVINYLTNMCWTGQGIVVAVKFFFVQNFALLQNLKMSYKLLKGFFFWKFSLEM